MSRVAAIFDRFGPYHVARLGAAAAACELAGIEVFGRSTEYAWDRVDSSERFERVTLFPDQDPGAVTPAAIGAALAATLQRLAPDAVAVPGWSHPAAITGVAWCTANRVPCIVMSESNAWDEPRRALREWVKRRVVGLCAAGLAGGEAHKEYLARLGMPANKVFLGYDAVDNAHFNQGADRARDDDPALRRQLGLPARYFLASARFVAKKNLPRLLEAYAAYRSAVPDGAGTPPWDLVLLGDGELSDDILALRRELGIDAHVHLPGFVQYPLLPVYYGLAGAFVHASSIEQWGLVVNEAMASGLPVIVSRTCGCAGSLVREGENGTTFDPQDVAALAQCLSRMASASGAARATMAARSREIIAAWGVARFASGLAAAVSEAMRGAAPRAGALDRALLQAMLRRRVSA